MITIKNTKFKSAVRLCTVLNVLTKDKIVAIITKLDEYISPNLKKAETAVRAAGIILHDPMLVLEDLCKDELKLVKEFVKAGPMPIFRAGCAKRLTNFRSMPWC